MHELTRAHCRKLTVCLNVVLGLLIGAVLVQLADWRWVFWFATIIALPVAMVSVLLIPAQHKQDESHQGALNAAKKMQGLDIIGVSFLTASFVLFIYAMTEGSAAGWGSAKVLAPLIISIFLIVAFLYYETIIPETRAAMLVANSLSKVNAYFI